MHKDGYRLLRAHAVSAGFSIGTALNPVYAYVVHEVDKAMLGGRLFAQ